MQILLRENISKSTALALNDNPKEKRVIINLAEGYKAIHSFTKLFLVALKLFFSNAKHSANTHFPLYCVGEICYLFDTIQEALVAYSDTLAV